MKTLPGPAEGLINFGYAVKRPLCEAVDGILGLKGSGIWSLTGFLDLCYEARRPYFMMADLACFPNAHSQ